MNKYKMNNALVSFLLPCVLLVPSVSGATETPLFFDTELSSITIDSGSDSSEFLALFFRMGKRVANGIILEGYWGMGLTDSTLVDEPIGALDTFRIWTELSQSYGVQARMYKKLSYGTSMFLLAGYGKTEIDFSLETCYGGFTVTCTSDDYSVSETGLSYGFGLSYGSFTLSYNVLFDDYVDSIGADARVTGINLGYVAKF